jgi:integrase
MPHTRLTEKTVAKLQAPTASGRQEIFWDEGPRAVRGFGVLVSGKTDTRSYIAQRDLPGGRTRRVTIAGVNELTLEEARARAAELIVDMRRGKDPKAKHTALTLREVLAQYIDARKKSGRKRSGEIGDGVQRYLSDWLDKPLPEITRDMVEKRHQRVAQDVEARHRAAAAESAKRYADRAQRARAKGWDDAATRHRAAAAAAAKRAPPPGHAAANGAMRALRLLWNYAADRDPSLGANPVKLKGQWFPVPPRERLVKAEEMPRFYRAVMRLENTVARDYLVLLLLTGMRRREAAGLRWSDIDLKARTLRIPAAITKAGRTLDLPLTDVVFKMLSARRALGDAKYVFPANSASGHIEEPKFALAQVAAACGVRVAVHDLRRTFVTVAESCDISPFALKALVNHSLPRGDVTAGYIQLTGERLRAPAERVADKLKQLCGIK